MNKIKTKRLICTSLSAMVLGTSFFISGIPKVNAYAADSTNIATSTAMPILVGAGKMDGVLKSVQYVNDSNYYGDVVVATITNGNGDYSYFAKVGTQTAEDLKNIAIGQTITINYVTGTPVQCDSKGAFPITSISTAIKQTTYTDSRGVIYQLNENDNTAIINSQTGISGDIVIPQQVTANGEQYTVTRIGEDAFGKCSNLKSIVIPDSVTRIGQYAFYGCTNLENVTLPNNLTAIEDRTFSGCSSLKSIILPGNIKDIGYNAFYVTYIWGFILCKWMVINFFSGQLIPIDFFPAALKNALDYLPFSGMSYTPAMIYLGKYSTNQIIFSIGVQVVWIGILYILYKILWAKAMKRVTVLGG